MTDDHEPMTLGTPSVILANLDVMSAARSRTSLWRRVLRNWSVRLGGGGVLPPPRQHHHACDGKLDGDPQHLVRDHAEGAVAADPGHGDCRGYDSRNPARRAAGAPDRADHSRGAVRRGGHLAAHADP